MISALFLQASLGINQEATSAPKVVVALEMYQDTTEGAITTVRDTVTALFKMGGYEVVQTEVTAEVWQSALDKKKPKLTYKVKDYMPDLPSPKELLLLGEKAGYDYVFVYRCKFHADNVWVTLGPKTKGYCTVDAYLVDVKNRELDMEASKLRADSTRVEKGWETAASILVSHMFTTVSGGPKTPHLQASSQLAFAKTFEPWLEKLGKLPPPKTD